VADRARLECNIVKKPLGIVPLVFSLMLFAVGCSLVKADPLGKKESLIWEDDVYSSGVQVTSPVLYSGTTYRIQASEIWFYDFPDYLAADAQYYTTSSIDTWDWVNHYLPGNHSFLQIDAQDVNWGPFSNGDEGTNHTYNIYYVGQSSAITFAIVDWTDHNVTNNFCHIHVRIYSELTVGGRVVDSSPPDTIRLWTVGALLLVSFVAVPVIVRVRKT
jgi:hypothetical protein